MKPEMLRYFTAFNNLSTKEEQQQAVFDLAKKLNACRGYMQSSAHQVDFDEAHEDIVYRLDIDNAQWSYTNRLALFYANLFFVNSTASKGSEVSSEP